MKCMNGPARVMALMLALLMFALPALAQGPRGEEKEPLVFQSEEHEARFKDLTLEEILIILQSPFHQGNTLALWALPIVVLLIGATGVFFTVRNRSRKLAAARQEASK